MASRSSRGQALHEAVLCCPLCGRGEEMQVQACGLRACAECDDVTKQCTACVAVPGIWRFPSRDFLLEDGECYLPADEILSHVGGFLLIAIVGLLVASMFLQCGIIMLRRSKAHTPTHPIANEGAESDKEMLLQHGDKMVSKSMHEPVDEADARRRSERAIAHGLTSWLQRQSMNWDKNRANGQQSLRPERYKPWETDVSRTYIMGVGLPLFYGFKSLVLVSALLTAATLYVVQRTKGRNLLECLPRLFRRYCVTPKASSGTHCYTNCVACVVTLVVPPSAKSALHLPESLTRFDIVGVRISLDR